MPASPPRLAVVVKGYPRLSETFIAQELLELQRRGYGFEIWSLRAPYDDKSHPMHAEITAPVRYLPEYLYQAPRRVLNAWWRVRKLPGYRQAAGTWWRDLWRDLTPNRVRRWGQALVMAAEIDRDASLIYAHFLHTPGSVARYAAVIHGMPWGFSAHAKDIWTTPDWEKREKIADASFGVTCTGTGAVHLQSLDTGGGTVELVYHGLDLSRFPPAPEVRPVPNVVTVLSVGRLVAKKGYDDLLTALSDIDDGVNWRFVHIGGGELKSELQGQAADLGIADRIEWLGKQDQTAVIAAMRRADVFVLPSKIAADGDRDGLPNVLMEAASQRLPILSTAVSAIPEFIENDVHGCLVAPSDPAALAMALRRLMLDADARSRMADAAYTRLVDAFGMTAGIDALDARLRAASTRQPAYV